MELLAPAGSKAALKAAVQSGADAVYIGGSKFSARRSAENFPLEDMKRQIEYCHIRGVAVHVAANILIKDKEKNEFLDYIGYVNEIGADALIIQDIGMASLVKKYFPDLPLHASTQMTAASLEAADYLAENGFSRVVLSRELTADEIAYISKNSKIQTEVFAHGALCICYSGQCLMSSMIGGRSGNRGMCAQPCRLSYELYNGNEFLQRGYLLSPKDLALIDEIKALKKANVTSLKIEGRMKRPEYVAAVTGIYRKVIDFTGVPSEQDRKTLTDAFNRSGFTKGYFAGRTGSGMMSIKTPGNVSENKFPPEVIRKCRPDTNDRKIDINIYAELRHGNKTELTFTDSDFNSVTVAGDIKAEPALTKGLTKERFEQQLSKLGNTPFNAASIETVIDDGIALPVSEINSVRRRAVYALERERSKIPKRRSLPFSDESKIAAKHDGFVFSAQILTLEQAEAVLKFDIPIVYAPPELAQSIKLKAPQREVFTALPPVMRKKDKKDVYIADGVLIYNIGQLKAFSDHICRGGAGLNVFNSDAVKHYSDLKSVEISYELNINEIRRIKPYIPLEFLCYGRIPLMLFGNCPIKAYSDCGNGHFLKDRQNQIFPLICREGCYSQLLNSKPVYMADKAEEIKKLPIGIYKLNFTTEDRAECEKILSEYTKALFEDQSVQPPKENTFTRGHYYRGVE